MTDFAMTVAGIGALAVLTAMCLAMFRALRGPTVYDRILAVNHFGSLTVLLIAAAGFLTGRPDFLDIAFVYCLISFIGTVAVLKFFEYGDLGHAGPGAASRPRRGPTGSGSGPAPDRVPAGDRTGARVTGSPREGRAGSGKSMAKPGNGSAGRGAPAGGGGPRWRRTC